MAMQDSLICQVTSGKEISSGTQKSYRATWYMVASVMVVLAQPMWAVAGPPDHARAVFMDGEVDMIHIDEVIPEKSRFTYFLHPKGSVNGRGVVEMIFEGEPPKGLRTGERVKIKGRSTKKKVWVSEIAALDGESSETSANLDAAAAAIGDRKTITFVINMDGVDYAEKGVSPYTQSHVDSSGKAMHDPVNFSVHSAYKEASFDQVTFSGNTTSDVFLVSIPYDPEEACSYYTIAADADAASPVNISSYQHRLYVVPPKAISGCGWLALGQVGSYGSTSARKSWSTRIDPIAFAHELGHNIGWHHAATDPDNDGTKNVEYGDTSDLMGYCCAKRKLNSVHVDQAGWFDAQNLQSKVVEVKTPGEYMLVPLGTDPGMSSEPQILKITPNTGRPYYLSYRQRTGMDVGMSSTYTTGVNIHRGEKGNNWSYFVKVLKSDFSDPNLYEFHDAENGIIISQVENNASNVKMDISFGGECGAGVPNVSVTPLTQVLTASSQLQPYNVTVTNTDTSVCQPSDWNVGLTSPLNGTVAFPVLTVAPGASSSTTVQMEIAGVSDGQYPITISATDSADTTHNVQVAASLEMAVNTCVMSEPTMILAPSQQMVSDVKDLQPYSLTVTNNDSESCAASTWSVGVISGLGSSVGNSLLHLAPGTNSVTSIAMSVEGAADGMYPINVTVSDGKSGHDETATASLQMDLTAPSAPSNVTAQLTGKGRNKSVQVAWDQASDGSGGTGIASYSVYRNSVFLGSPTSLNFKDSDFSTTVTNVYKVFAMDQANHTSLTPGTASYTDGGGGTKPGGGKGKKK